MSNPLKILMLEDSATDAEIVQRLLKKEKPYCEFSLAMDREAYVLALDQFKPDIILADNSLPQFSAAEALEITRRSLSHTPFIMVTNTESEESDTDIIRLGADDYVLKDRLMRLPVAIEAALKQQNAEKEKLAAIEKLNLNEENYRNMVERISDGFIALDLNWRFTYINKKAEQLFRRPQGSLIGKQIWSEFPETIDRPFYKAYHKAMETQENSTLKEYSILLESWVEANIYPSLSGISIYFRDITEQKKAEEKLKEREDKYRSLVEDATDGIFIAGPTGDLLDANTSLCAMFGCTKEEMLKANFRDGLSEEDLKNNPIRYDELKKGFPLLRELRIKKPDGSALYVEISSRMLPDGQIQGIVRNISERKKKEEQLKESEEKYRNLIERTSDGVLIYSFDGAILDFNHSSYNYLGYTKEEFRKFNIKDFFFEEDLKKNPLRFERLKAGYSTIDYRRLKRKDGSGVEMEISTAMLPDGSVMAFGRDISERKKMEEEQRSNLEELAAVYMLSNSLSHAGSVEEIFTEAMNSLHDTIHTDRTSILLFDTDGVMRFKAWRNLSEEYRRAVEGHSPWSKNTKNAEPIFVINVEEDPGVEQWLSYFKKEGISALGFIPIMQNGNVIGKLMLYSNTPRIFSKRESKLAQNIASHVAFAIERQKAEKELRLKENAISTSISGMGMIDLTGKIIYANEALGKMWGCADMEELIGKMLTDVFEKPGVFQTIEALRTKGFKNGEDIGKKMDGTLFNVAFSANVIKDENGNPVCMFGSFIDITKRKNAEEETRRSNERFEMVARATNDAVWELDLLTGESWYNDTFLLLFGTDPYGVIIKPTVEFWKSKLHPDDRERVFINLYNTCAGTSSVWADEFRFQRPDGSYGIFYDRGFIQRDGSGKAVRITGSMIDITELKKVQKQLKDSEEKYRNLIEEASDAIFINDKNGNLLDANKSAGNMLGYTKEEFCTMNITNLFTDEELANRPIMLKDLLSGERTSLERNMRHKNGSQIPVDIAGKILTDGRIIAIVRDNRERKKAEEEIRRSNERFQSLSRATNDAVWDWDLQTDEVWWNESFYNILGYDPKLPVPDLYEWTKKIHPDDREQLITKLKNVRKENITNWEDEFRFQLADGSYGTALDRAYLLRDDSGKPVRVIGALMDITQRKRLVKEMEVLSMIAKETSNGVMIYNKETKDILWINEGFTRLTGYTQQDMYGKTPGSILYGTETDQNTINYISDQKASNLPYSADILIYTKEGKKKWHYISGQPMPDENGQITKYFVLSTDISDRLRIEQERLSDNIRLQKEVTRAILQAQEAERNELGRELHDNINQILSAISMKLDFCIENYPTSKAIAEDCRQNVQDAIKETRNLSHRMVMPRFSEISLKQILRSLVSHYNAKQIVELDTDQMKEKDIPAAVKETLFRIVQEQFSNIQKHAKADKVRIRLSNDPGQIAMLIEDNGVGFDTHQKRKGIGITNILNRVESYNGAVDIISQPGRGCTLSVNIPLTGLNDDTVTNGF